MYHGNHDIVYCILGIIPYQILQLYSTEHFDYVLNILPIFWEKKTARKMWLMAETNLILYHCTKLFCWNQYEHFCLITEKEKRKWEVKHSQ